MAKKKSGTTRTDEVRQYLEEHPDAMPTQVVAVMAGRGIEVTPNFVSQVKTRMRSDGEKATTKATKKTAKKATKTAAKKKAAGAKAAGTQAASRPVETAAAPLEKAPTPVRRGDELSADDLFEAKRLADELGGIEKARQALDYLERLR